MPPFSFQKPTKNALKLELGRHQFFDGFLHRFFIDFPSIGDANLELSWPLRSPKTRPRRLQDGFQDEVRDIFRSSGVFAIEPLEPWKTLADKTHAQVRVPFPGSRLREASSSDRPQWLFHGATQQFCLGPCGCCFESSATPRYSGTHG